MDYIAKTISMNNIKILILFLLSTILLNGCELFNWSNDDFTYKVSFVNTTKDTIHIMPNSKYLTCFDYKNYLILPNSTKEIEKVGVNEGQNPIKEFLAEFAPTSHIINVYRFNDSIYKECLIDSVFNYIDSTTLNSCIITTWVGPPEKLADTIHNIYNLNVWERFDNKRMIQFTIYEEDVQ